MGIFTQKLKGFERFYGISLSFATLNTMDILEMNFKWFFDVTFFLVVLTPSHCGSSTEVTLKLKVNLVIILKTLHLVLVTLCMFLSIHNKITIQHPFQMNGGTLYRNFNEFIITTHHMFWQEIYVFVDPHQKNLKWINHENNIFGIQYFLI